MIERVKKKQLSYNYTVPLLISAIDKVTLLKCTRCIKKHLDPEPVNLFEEAIPAYWRAVRLL